MNYQLASAKKLLEHLITWGEITRCEFNSIAGVQAWVAAFEKAGILHPSGTDIWSLVPELWGLFREEPEKAVRSVLFQVPDYRSYLISILAEGLVSAAKQGLHDEVEKWSGNELLPLLSCINQKLNKIEIEGKRIINQRADLIPALFAAFPERQSNWDSWNQLLLGQTARPQDLFDCVLKRFVPYANPVSCDACGRSPALLPFFPLADVDDNALFMNPSPAPWNIRRANIQSGIALFDEHGKPMFDSGTTESARKAFQDALIEQPFYKAVTQLAIYHYRAHTTSSSDIELVIQPGAGLSAVELFYETRRIGLLKEWLPLLVQCQECFAARALEDAQIENMMENLLALDILKLSDDNFILHEDFQATLMAGRLGTVYRPGKTLQKRMLEALKLHLHHGMAGVHNPFFNNEKTRRSLGGD